MEEKTKHFKPYVPLEQVFNYDVNKPETYTASPFVNAVMEAFQTLRPFSVKRMERYLGLSASTISAGLEIATGCKLLKLREEWAKHEVEKHPWKSLEIIASELGFANRSAVWKALHRDKRKKKYAADKKSQEAFMKLSPEEKKAYFEEAHRIVEESHRRLMKTRANEEKSRIPNLLFSGIETN